MGHCEVLEREGDIKFKIATIDFWFCFINLHQFIQKRRRRVRVIKIDSCEAESG